MAGFPDTYGLICYQTFIGVWPTSEEYDVYALSAILNGPLANAFVATREGKSDITTEILDLIPLPYFTESQKAQLRLLIQDYQRVIDSASYDPDDPELSYLLMEIDALVLKAYRLHPKIETELLKFFQGQSRLRPTRHAFGDYLPPDFDVYFSLSDYLSPRFQEATAGEMRKRMGLA